jgi:UDP-glucuronate 4-epimerase
MTKKRQKVALVTGAAGFIGFHLSKRLLDEGWRVVGLDCLSDYYDVSLKKHRESILFEYDNYISIHKKVEDTGVLLNLFSVESPDIVIHLAAQAGVRYSIDNPRSYLESNIIGTFELLEAARAFPPKHMLLASTSSAYGANDQMPYKETDKADHQMSFYAATKKSTESMAHSYSHLFDLPITMFRFFTVYGPWGRPDMALFKFTKAILNGEKIDVYNGGNMSRDFTYIDDLVESIFLLFDAVPTVDVVDLEKNHVFDNKSPVAQFRVVNIGNSKPEKLSTFIQFIEIALGIKAKQNLLPIQAGDVPATWADSSLLENLTGHRPKTNLRTGVEKFVKWYKDYYKL